MFYAWLSLANKKRGFLLVTYNKGLFRPSAYQADSLSEISEILVWPPFEFEGRRQLFHYIFQL